MADRASNRLINATSPYLLQHANNPVDWYEWGPDALERAKREVRPILLSVGYAACHWCHVMAHESFEDPQVAGLMNEHFVCIKVDREERPDLDAIYMDAVQSMTGHGGWPMTVFLTPGGEPFFGGTYFPPEDRHGLPGFPKVLRAIAEAWRDRRDDLLAQGKKLGAALAQGLSRSESKDPLSEGILRQAHASLAGVFDRTWGGFGPAPKFPQPMTLEFLLRMHRRGYEGALEMVALTLDRMAAGGIHDEVGGGSHRYSTDERWLVPHFGKMLYDNAQLARLYLHAWQVTGDEGYRRVVNRTLSYLTDELRHEDGGFFSSQDADSEGVEGKYYVWSWDELAKLAGEQMARRLGASPEGNWDGINILWRPDGAPDADVSADVIGSLVETRQRRVHPATDDKILACWNGLAIQAFAEAGRAMGQPAYTRFAAEAADFVLTQMRREDGRLLRAWREGRTSGPAYLDDYAAMASACLSLYEATFDLRWMREARSLAADMIRLFRDPERGGFFQTGSDAETLVVRPKELFDNAVPSGNSMAAEVLQRLAHLTGDAEYERAGVSAIRVAANLMTRAPSAFGQALGALDLYLGPSNEVAIVGDPSEQDARALIHEVWTRYMPNTVLAVGRPDDEEAASVIPLLAARPQQGGRAAAYVCERFACKMPMTEPAGLAAELARYP